MEHGDLHAARLEGALLPDRQGVRARLGRVLERAPTGTTGSRARTTLCQNCAMHSGFEASVVMDVRKHPRDLLRLAAWNFTG